VCGTKSLVANTPTEETTDADELRCDASGASGSPIGELRQTSLSRRGRTAHGASCARGSASPRATAATLAELTLGELIGLVADAVADRLDRRQGRHDTGSERVSLRDARGASVRQLRAAIASGELAAVRLGREYRVAQGDVDEWIASRPVAPNIRGGASPKVGTAAERAIDRARRAGSLRVVGGAR
jgi:excisionase family DNA binding protein